MSQAQAPRRPGLMSLEDALARLLGAAQPPLTQYGTSLNLQEV